MNYTVNKNPLYIPNKEILLPNATNTQDETPILANWAGFIDLYPDAPYVSTI